MVVTTLAAEGFVNTVNNGSLVAAAAVSLLVGVVGFLSPCVLPLVPGYLSYVAGLVGSEEGRIQQRKMIAGALLFVLGFTAVFVAGGALFGTLGSRIAEHHTTLQRIFGVFTIVMGLVFIGRIPFLQRELKIHKLPKSGLIGAPILGITFGLAWTPCLAPTFSAVYSLAAMQATAGRGAILSAVYCLGLGIPFVLVAAGLGWVSGALTIIKRHGRLISQGGGALLMLFGILMFTGTWDHWMNWLNTKFAGGFFGSDL